MSDLEKVKQNAYYLEYVQHQTKEICLVAVKQNGRVLKFVHHQTKAICIEAVKEDYGALPYVQPQYFKTTINMLRMRALFDPELDKFIKECEEKMLI